MLTGTHLHSSLRAPGTACSGWSRHSPALGRAFRTRQRGRSRSPQVPTFLGTTSPGSLHPGGRPGEATMSLLPECHWLRYPPVPTLKGTPLRSPCPGTSPPARLPARLPLARGAAGSSPSPVPSSSSRKTGNAMGLVRGSLRLAGLGGGCCFPVSRWHTPQPRDPEQAARQRRSFIEHLESVGRPHPAPAPGRGGRSAPLGTGVPPRRWGPRSIARPGWVPRASLVRGDTAGTVPVPWADPASGGGTGRASSRASCGRGGSSICLAPWAEPRAPGPGGGHGGGAQGGHGAPQPLV